MRKFSSIATLGLVIAALIVGPAAVQSRAADHLDAPLVRADSRIDITDIYAFTHGSNTVLIMNVNPLAGAGNPTTFRPDAQYAFRIDNSGDSVEDVVFRLHFSSPNAAGQQAVVLKMATGQ